jgi:hypothetical protein
MATEHWKEHELPGIHYQPEWPSGWWELPQGAAEGMAELGPRLSVWSPVSKGNVEFRPCSGEICLRGQDLPVHSWLAASVVSWNLLAVQIDSSGPPELHSVRMGLFKCFIKFPDNFCSPQSLRSAGLLVI